MNITAWAGSGRGYGQEMWSIVGRVSVIPANIIWRENPEEEEDPK